MTQLCGTCRPVRKRGLSDAYELKLTPGMYYLVFSNRFSAFTEKQVFLEVDLNFKKAETYYE